MQAALFKTAIDIAKNSHFQRVALGFVIGGAVGFAIAKTVEPFLFPEVEYEMIPPYDTPELAIEREATNAAKVMSAPIFEAVSTKTGIGRATIIEETANGVEITDVTTGAPGVEIANKIIANTMPKPKYAKPVHAAAVTPTVQPITGVEKLAAMKPASAKLEQHKDQKPPVSTFSSTRGVPLSNAGGGDPHKKTRVTGE